MGIGGEARALARFQYRLMRLPFDLIDTTVMRLIFDDGALSRLVYQRALIECDRAVAFLLDDDSAAAHAEMLHRRSATVRYAAARQRRRNLATDAVLDGHRARFRDRQHRPTVDPQ
ncbi:hypothetical protein [Rhodococcus koreensis]|uniref:Uncharacterized protein n=1 Tax=Rhodococcus koreensis TaxID=99653 RepID=A0A1H4IHC3_9NOCA|nr:hypothetical protein [Rhodococcus koreensis]SEB33380.1 hypothetical protein SAMN04490239_0716 [Rhodococcus koreensis]SEB67086.1 hypothetical protein SAMN04490239_1148 [Rhodococcus koreensis]